MAWLRGHGGLYGLWLQDARSSDRAGPAFEAAYPAPSLRIVDTAYLSSADLRAASGSRQYWISGVKAKMLLRQAQGRWWNLAEWVESQPAEAAVVAVWVQAGKQEQVPQEAVRRRKRRANRTVERRPRRKVRACSAVGAAPSADPVANHGSAPAGATK